MKNPLNLSGCQTLLIPDTGVFGDFEYFEKDKDDMFARRVAFHAIRTIATGKIADGHGIYIARGAENFEVVHLIRRIGVRHTFNHKHALRHRTIESVHNGFRTMSTLSCWPFIHWVNRRLFGSFTRRCSRL